MENKHTQGPWEIKESVVSACGEGRTQRNRQMISLSCYEVWQNQRRICTMINKANAQLIAVAPKLKEYGYDLAMLILQSDAYKYPDVRDAVDRLLAIINKATGK